MKKLVLTGLAALLVIALLVAAQEPEIVNLSEDRELGVGIQLDFPFGGLISTRYWFEPTFGLEGILFLWSDGGDVEGMATGRALYRIADAPVVDFYGAAGVTIPFSSTVYGLEPFILSAAGGIEFGLRFAPSLAWNIEFGFSLSGMGEVQMLFGTGIHFYFLEEAATPSP
jgi:hypothetical protein